MLLPPLTSLKAADQPNSRLLTHVKPRTLGSQIGHDVRRCRHNQVYWRNAPFHAFGMSAASYRQARRVTRPRTLQAYQRWVRALADGKDPVAGLEADSLQDQLLDVIMLTMRTSDGLNLVLVEQHFGRCTLSPSPLPPPLPSLRICIQSDIIKVLHKWSTWLQEAPLSWVGQRSACALKHDRIPVAPDKPNLVSKRAIICRVSMGRWTQVVWSH